MAAKKMPKICGSQTKKSVLLWEGRAREPHRGLSMPFSYFSKNGGMIFRWSFDHA
jgi:hypothetical protein